MKNSRWPLILLAAFVVLLLAYFAPQDSTDEDISAPGKLSTRPGPGARAPRVAGKGSGSKALALPALRFASESADRSFVDQGNLFENKSWVSKAVPQVLPKTPPQPVAEAPRAATAPPLPFSFLGTYAEAGKKLVYLQLGDRVIVAAEGDVIDGQYRVASIRADRIALTWLPLGTVQSIVTGSAP